MKIKLAGQSAEELEALAAEASRLAADLRKAEPSLALALAAGVLDVSYDTVRWGRVRAYRGEAVVTMANGRRWRAVGRPQRGSPEVISRHGFVEWFPLEEEAGK